MKQSRKTPLLIGLGIIAIVAVVIGIGFTKSQNNSGMSGMNMKTSSSAAADAVATSTVQIKSYAFAPGAIKVKAGTTVTWTNQDAVHHSVTVDGGNGPKSDLFAKGQSYSFKFDKAGTYTYHCMPHPYMHGTVIVTD